MKKIPSVMTVNLGKDLDRKINDIIRRQKGFPVAQMILKLTELTQAEAHLVKCQLYGAGQGLTMKFTAPFVFLDAERMTKLIRLANKNGLRILVSSGNIDLTSGPVEVRA